MTKTPDGTLVVPDQPFIPFIEGAEEISCSAFAQAITRAIAR